VRILLLHARSQYRLMNAFLDAIAEGFVENGHAIAVAHLDDLSRPVTDADLIV